MVPVPAHYSFLPHTVDSRVANHANTEDLKSQVNIRLIQFLIKKPNQAVIKILTNCPSVH